MLSVPGTVQIFVCLTPTDMRKSIDGLAGLASTVLEQDPLSGHLFVFAGKRRDRVKLLYWDGDGYALWYKELESEYPRFFLFTEFGRKSHNLARRPVAAGGMDASSLKSGPRRRPMSAESPRCETSTVRCCCCSSAPRRRNLLGTSATSRRPSGAGGSSYSVASRPNENSPVKRSLCRNTKS